MSPTPHKELTEIKRESSFLSHKKDTARNQYGLRYLFFISYFLYNKLLFYALEMVTTRKKVAII